MTGFNTKDGEPVDSAIFYANYDALPKAFKMLLAHSSYDWNTDVFKLAYDECVRNADWPSEIHRQLSMFLTAIDNMQEREYYYRLERMIYMQIPFDAPVDMSKRIIKPRIVATV